MSQEMYFSRMKELLNEEYDAYIDSLSKPLYRGMRVNLKKAELNEFDYLNHPSKFCKESYYVDKPLGNHPMHICGCFYLQEPSASSAVEILDVQENDYVLDLCAAPGGKSIALSSLIKPSILVCNDISFKRAEALKLNVERSGIENVVVTSQDPHAFLKDFEGYFDCVILDAPCSGSGMTRKKEKMEDDWSWEKVEKLVPIQKDLIELAYKLVKKNGLISYSTCSYAKQEDEQIVCYLMENHEVELLNIPDDGSLKGIEGIGRQIGRAHV